MRNFLTFFVAAFVVLTGHAYENESAAFEPVKTSYQSESSECRFDQPVEITFSEDVYDTINNHEELVAFKDKTYSAYGIYKYSLTKLTNVLGVNLKTTDHHYAVIVTDEYGEIRNLSTSFLSMISKMKLKVRSCK